MKEIVTKIQRLDAELKHSQARIHSRVIEVAQRQQELKQLRHLQAKHAKE